ncbi:MAG: hypothetical protein ACTHJ3_00885 [Pararhizobium sp.]
MEHLSAIMILIACSGPNTCHELPAPTVGYETVATCEGALRPVMIDAVRRERQVYGTCAAVDPSVFEKDATVMWDLSKDGRISVRIVDEDEEMARQGSLVASR